MGERVTGGPGVELWLRAKFANRKRPSIMGNIMEKQYRDWGVDVDALVAEGVLIHERDHPLYEKVFSQIPERRGGS